MWQGLRAFWRNVARRFFVFRPAELYNLLRAAVQRHGIRQFVFAGGFVMPHDAKHHRFGRRAFFQLALKASYGCFMLRHGSDRVVCPTRNLSLPCRAE